MISEVQRVAEEEGASYIAGYITGELLQMFFGGAVVKGADTTADIGKGAKFVDNLDDVAGAGKVGKGSSGIDFDLSKLSRSQRKAIETADNIINDYLKSGDLSAALGDLQGNPIAKPNGGYWNHAQEVKDAYTGLVRAEKTLAGSLQSPNLAPDVRAFIQGKYDSIINYISIIEELFAPYGGVK